MRDYGLFGILAAIVVILVAVFTGTYSVSQTQQALVLRFGEPVAGRGLVTEPGLHYKLPLIEDVVRRSNQLLNLETPNLQVIASNNDRLQVDAFLRYKIVDLLKFYQTLQTEESSESQLGYILNSAIRRVLADADLTQIVRDDRAKLMDRIRTEVNGETQRFGIETVDVRIRRADLPQQISEKVYDRMRSERELQAAEYRARGREAAQKIVADADRQVAILLGNAQQTADTVRGQGEAERNKIFADAYGKDTDFFAFFRLMDAYDDAFKGSNTRLVLTPSRANEFFRFFKSPDTSAQAASAPAEAASGAGAAGGAGATKGAQPDVGQAGSPAGMTGQPGRP